MTAENKPASANTASQCDKREYIKPAFRHEQVFEVMALACGKVSSTSGACHANRKTS